MINPKLTPYNQVQQDKGLYENERPKLFFYCTAHNFAPVESFMNEHKLWHIQTGFIQFYKDGQSFKVKAGETVLLRRNQLVRATLMNGENGEPFEMTKLVFTRDFLKSLYAENPEISDQNSAFMSNYQESFPVTDNELMTSFFKSLKPYLNTKQQINQELSINKTKEVFLLLEMIWPGIKQFLFDFNEPGKIDLEQFMQRNFFYNIPLTSFAYLSGRSLTTFKRDFHKLYHTSPHKWLMEQRLKEANHLIINKKQKPSAVYIQVGFESLSHFSKAFKKHYGFNVSSGNHK